MIHIIRSRRAFISDSAFIEENISHWNFSANIWHHKKKDRMA